MGPMAALMCLFDHVKDDLLCLDNNATLLADKYSFVMVGGDEQEKQGTYLYYDLNDGKLIRSGKVTGRAYTIRHQEHYKRAATKRCTSKFYRRYPSKSVHPNNVSTTRKGWFENLQQLVALGWRLEDADTMQKVTIEYKNGGLFLYTNEENKNINALNMRGLETEIRKRNDVVAYLIEITYDLCISPIYNVSKNPGFEGCLGVW